MLLLIQNGYFVPSITKYLKQEYLIIKSFETNVSDIDLDNYEIIIILGGNQTLTNIKAYPYLLNVVKMIRKCLVIDKALIGICLGAQLIAYAIGAKIATCQKNNIGYDVDILSYNNIFRYHRDYIVPTNLITIIEYFDSMPYLYKYGSKVCGIQCHPDIDPDYIQNYTTHASIIKYARENKDAINKKNLEIINELFCLVEPAKLFSQFLDPPDFQRKSGLGVYQVEPDISQPSHKLFAHSKVEDKVKN